MQRQYSPHHVVGRSLRLRSSATWSLIWILYCLCCLFPASVEALFGNKRRKQREAELLAKKLAAEAAARQQKIYIAAACVTVILVGIVSLILFSGMFGFGKVKKSGNRPDSKGTVDVVVVGCGLPKKSMVSLIADASEFLFILLGMLPLVLCLTNIYVCTLCLPSIVHIVIGVGLVPHRSTS
jgi:hypothetical protein